MTFRIISGAGLAAFLVLAGCDNGPSAVETRDRAAVSTDAAMTSGTFETAEADRDAAPIEKPVLTANRRETVDAKITRLYERNGTDFGAISPEDFLVKVRSFTENPPAGVDTAKRPNGDTLYYQASTNTFAVVDRDGTPRTMFKPDDGPTYWAEQKERAPTFGQRRSEG